MSIRFQSKYILAALSCILLVCCNEDDAGDPLPCIVATACDDGNPHTSNDVFNANCECAGTCTPGTSCDDNNAATDNDILNADCECEGSLRDCLAEGDVDGDGICGDVDCDDYDAGNTEADADGDGICTPLDCDDQNADVYIGAACDDGNNSTINDMINQDCICSGVPENSIQGIVTLPIGSPILIDDLTVFTAIDNLQLTNEQFQIEEGDQSFTTQFVLNSADEVMLMGYRYPGDVDHSIDARSTALAMIMNAPAVLDISDQGKLALINSVQTDPNYNNLVDEIENTLMTGEGLFDESNTSLIQAYTALFESASFRYTEEEELPVNMFRAGRNFIFNNSGKAISTVIGIYDQNNNRIEKLTVSGIKLVPGSVTETVNGYGGSSGNVVDVQYSLAGEGGYTFKFRTGQPGASGGSLEHDEAFYENLGLFGYNLIVTLVPFLTSGCYATIKNNVYTTVTNISGLTSSSTAGLGSILYTVTSNIFGNINSLAACAETVLQENWFTSFGSFLGFVNTAFGVIGEGANTTILGVQWAATNPAVDLQFCVEENIAWECLIDTRDQTMYPLISMGELKVFDDNLAYAGGNSLANGSRGRLYSWESAQTACPEGSHIPNGSELGVIANNRSLFTNQNHLLTGYVHVGICGGCQMGQVGYFYSSTTGTTNNGFPGCTTWFPGHSNPGPRMYFRDYHAAVKCVKD